MEPAGFLTLISKGWPQVQALQEATPGDVVGKRLDRDAGLYAPDIGLGQVDQVERDIPRAAEDDLGGSFYHVGYSMTGRRETLSRLHARTKAKRHPLTLAPPWAQELALAGHAHDAASP